MPLASVTLMMPTSATRPDALTMALVEATWPLLIPIETDVPPLHAVLEEAICTFHSPSKVAAAAGAATANPASSRTGAAAVNLRNCPMMCPIVPRGHRPMPVPSRL